MGLDYIPLVNMILIFHFLDDQFSFNRSTLRSFGQHDFNLSLSRGTKVPLPS